MKFFNNKDREDVDKVNKLIMWLEAKDEQGVYNFVRVLNEAHEHPDHSVILEYFHKTAFRETTVYASYVASCLLSNLFLIKIHS